MTAALDDLQKRLTDILAGRPRQLGWGHVASIGKSLAAVQARFPRKGSRLMVARVTRGVMALRVLGASADFTHLKYACHGIAQQNDLNGRRLLEDTALVKKLLAIVYGLREHPRRFAACRLGLLRSCQAAEALPKLPATRDGRRLLQEFLALTENI
jgi:hypothetical protein